MTNGEYINFNELIPFCDPTAEEDPDWETTSERFQLFPELGLIQPGHKLKYTFLQWANCFVIYMAVMASKKHDNVAHMCAYFSTILKASKEFTADWWRPVRFSIQAAGCRHSQYRLVHSRHVTLQSLLHWPCEEGPELFQLWVDEARYTRMP